MADLGVRKLVFIRKPRGNSKLLKYMIKLE